MLQQFTCYHMTSSNQPHVSENEEGMWEAYVMFLGSQDKWQPGIPAQVIGDSLGFSLYKDNVSK